MIQKLRHTSFYRESGPGPEVDGLVLKFFDGQIFKDVFLDMRVQKLTCHLTYKF